MPVACSAGAFGAKKGGGVFGLSRGHILYHEVKEMLWMNKIYLSGIVAEPPVRGIQEGALEHACFGLWVSHRTRQGISKREFYPVHGWNGVAAWAAAHLRQGQRVMVQGYLTQRRVALQGGGMVTVNEITAEELFPGGGDRLVGDKPAESHGEDMPAAENRQIGISKED